MKGTDCILTGFTIHVEYCHNHGGNLGHYKMVQRGYLPELEDEGGFQGNVTEKRKSKGCR
jgi:hypothetical protein